MRTSIKFLMYCPKLKTEVEVILDKKTLQLFADYHWSLNSQGYLICTNRVGQKAVMRNMKFYRFILNAQPGEIVDHINGNTYDNRFQNLRKVTIEQSNQNRGPIKNRLGSKFKGVKFMTDCPLNPYSANIRHKGKTNYLGSFPSETAAALAYNQAALNLFGKFARLNNV